MGADLRKWEGGTSSELVELVREVIAAEHATVELGRRGDVVVHAPDGTVRLPSGERGVAHRTVSNLRTQLRKVGALRAAPDEVEG